MGQKLKLSSNFPLQRVQYFMRETVYNEEGSGANLYMSYRAYTTY